MELQTEGFELMLERRFLDPEKYGVNAGRIGYWVVDSGREGPVFAALAAQHGNELCGSAAIRDFVHLAERELQCGSFIGIPFANPPAVHRRIPNADLAPGQPYIESACNMASLWSSGGDLCSTSGIAECLWKELLSKADYIVDMHCYPKFMAPVAAARRTPECEKLVRASAMPFVRYVPEDADWQGSIRVRALRENKIPLGIELSGQYELYPGEVRRGFTVLSNIAKTLGMLPGEVEGTENPPLELGPCATVYSPGVGLFIPEERLCTGAWFGKGELLGILLEEITLKETAVYSPEDGYILRMPSRPNCDVALRDHSQFVFLDDELVRILPVRQQ